MKLYVKTRLGEREAGIHEICRFLADNYPVRILTNNYGSNINYTLNRLVRDARFIIEKRDDGTHLDLFYIEKQSKELRK